MEYIKLFTLSKFIHVFPRLKKIMQQIYQIPIWALLLITGNFGVKLHNDPISKKFNRVLSIPQTKGIDVVSKSVPNYSKGGITAVLGDVLCRSCCTLQRKREKDKCVLKFCISRVHCI